MADFSDLAERVELGLWKLMGGEDVRPKLFTMKDARRFLFDCSEDDPKVDGCVLSITPKGEKFEVVQLMVDQTGHIIKKSPSTYLGRQITASAIDDSVVEFMAGETRKMLKL